MSNDRSKRGEASTAHRPRSLLAVLTGYEVLVRRSDRQNIERLRAELGCSFDDARHVYELAREQGFGAAYETVFGTPPRVQRRAMTAPLSLRDARVHRGLSSRHGPRRQVPRAG